ncbi:MAG: hypothetical protein P1P80_09295 [ANME-2 cluster archaeon]|nr:hypothetical protein [ANME-2 cluster archaeon]
MTPYTGYSKELFPVADRAATLLVKNEGYWTDGNDYGTEWNAVWGFNQSHVKKIGLIKDTENYIIDSRKLNVFMNKRTSIYGEISWWEYPVSFTDPAEIDNASRAMGLDRHYFYIQVRPVNESNINVSEADAAAIEAIGEQSNVVAVNRLALNEQTTFGNFTGADLLGHVSPTKLLFVIEPQDFDLITNGIRFSIRDWEFEGTENESAFQYIKIGDAINANYDLTDSNKLSDDEFKTFKNGVNISGIGGFSFNDTDIIEFFIPRSTLDSSLPEMYSSGKEMYIQLNVKSEVNISDDGLTHFSNTKKTKTYPAKMTLWVW